MLATNDFTDEAIGVGGFGKVYKGELSLPPERRNTIVAFKRLDRKFGQGDAEFWKEIMMLSQYKHANLISLVGYCDENAERILVYEYASHGSLDRYLENRIHDIVSNNLKKELEMDIDLFKTFASIAYRCLHRERKERPTMSEIIKELPMSIEEQELMSEDVNGRAEYKELISIAKQNITPKTGKSTPITSRSKTELELVLSKGIFVVDADLSEMTLKEAIGRLKTYEERIKYKKGKQVNNQEKLMFTPHENKGKYFRGRGHGKHRFSQKINHENFKEEKKDGETPHRNYNRNNFKKSSYDTSKLQCYKCKKIEHIAPNCPQRAKPNEQSNLVEEDFEPTLLMAILKDSNEEKHVKEVEE
nr:phloem protein 2-like protein [Tanacetum cinerariifolium]